MPKTEVTKSGETSIGRPHDVFSAMRTEMDREFERFEHGWPRMQTLFQRAGGITVPELDVRENSDSIIVEVELPGVEEGNDHGAYRR